MCDSPIQIKNPNFAPTFGKRWTQSVKYNRTKYSAVKNPLDSYLYVPCGHCRACRTLSQLYLIQRAVEHAKGRWVIFGTATYSQEALPVHRLHFKNGNVRDVPVADFDDFRLMVKRIRKSGEFPSFTYFCASEYGSETKHGPKKTGHRPHFHYFIYVDKKPDDTLFEGFALAEKWNDLFVREWRRNIAVNCSGRRTTRGAKWIPLSKFIRASRMRRGTYDVHLLVNDSPNCSEDDPFFYATSYTLGFDDWQERYIQMAWYNCDFEEYKAFKKKFRTRILVSKGFGISENTETFVRDCINWSLSNGCLFANYLKSDGATLPLCRYYQRRFLKMKDFIKFRSRNEDCVIKGPDGELVCTTQPVPNFDQKKLLEIKNKNAIFGRVLTQLKNNHDVILFDDE